ncbi:MAG: hypothetical protein KA369_08330 [Spirochaetes bacterium]|nr:hypothetical protein [Spirochaetota bacterium]
MTKLSEYSKEEIEVFLHLRERICPMKCGDRDLDCKDDLCLSIIEDLMRHIMRHGRIIQSSNRRLDYGC